MGLRQLLCWCIATLTRHLLSHSNGFIGGGRGPEEFEGTLDIGKLLRLENSAGKFRCGILACGCSWVGRFNGRQLGKGVLDGGKLLLRDKAVICFWLFMGRLWRN